MVVFVEITVIRFDQSFDEKTFILLHCEQRLFHQSGATQPFKWRIFGSPSHPEPHSRRPISDDLWIRTQQIWKFGSFTVMKLAEEIFVTVYFFPFSSDVFLHGFSTTRFALVEAHQVGAVFEFPST
ncbi:hypothetical protein CSKR_203555 [Clonorchis sinensis]|uniref:Uncharacterized protein n=1 Tax=Clonorchis sinensis TaxID=79923 RepID=A0A419PX97_CLOSI|nr:hypothetical protein CSKR_203555 [Clonorchis sinensis]